MSRKQDFYYWRIFATGLCFTTFGLGGVVLGLVVLPLNAFLTPDPRRRVQRSRRIVHYSFKAFILMMKYLGILTYSIHGQEHLDVEGALIIANHPTLIDIVFLISLMPDATCIVKSDLARNPFTRGPVAWAGYIVNDTPEELIERCSELLSSGANLIIFPEGTRSVQGHPIKFKRGAAYIWLRSKCRLITIILNSSPPTLSKGDKWYQVPDRRFHYTIDIHEGFMSSADEESLQEGKNARHVNRLWQDFFDQEISS
jgi:1-acyl-sn-glycerol-3-phosphate acyltransferase